MSTIAFTVPGQAATKGRPRFAVNGKFVRTYTPDKTVEFENLVKLAFMQSEGEKLSGAIGATLTFCFQPPKSVSKKKRAEMLSGITKPVTVSKDIDNLAKAVLDALNGIAYDDDRQVVALIARKEYAEEAKTIVKLEEIGE